MYRYTFDTPATNIDLTHYAAMYGIQGMMHAILQKAGQAAIVVNSKDEMGRTPLSWAAENGHEAIFRPPPAMSQVDINSKDDKGQVLLSWARKKA